MGTPRSPSSPPSPPFPSKRKDSRRHGRRAEPLQEPAAAAPASGRHRRRQRQARWRQPHPWRDGPLGRNNVAALLPLAPLLQDCPLDCDECADRQDIRLLRHVRGHARCAEDHGPGLHRPPLLLLLSRHRRDLLGRQHQRPPPDHHLVRARLVPQAQGGVVALEADGRCRGRGELTREAAA